MHMQGEPSTMQQAPVYRRRGVGGRAVPARACRRAGRGRRVARAHRARSGHRLRQDAAAQPAAAAGLDERLVAAGPPVLVGLSRKSMIGAPDRPAGRIERLAGSLGGDALRRSSARRGDRAGARRGRPTRRAARGAGDRRSARQPQTIRGAEGDGTQIFRHRWRARHGGRGRSRPEFVMRLGLRGRPARVLARQRGGNRQAGGAHRQGHADLGLHARGGAAGRLLCGRRRRAAFGADPDSGDRLPDARAAPVGGCRDQRLAQSVRGQRHQVLLGRRQQAARPGRGAIEAEIEQPMGCVRSRRLGKARRIDDAAGRYIEFCKSSFPGALDLRGMRLVVDCAHGAGYHTVPHVFHELGADVVPIGVSPNGLNINDGCGATEPGALQRAVLEHKADLGIAVDGDADRLMMVDAAGRLYNGDELLYVIVRDRREREPVPGAVGTLMSNLGLEQALGRLGVQFERARVGDRYVLELMQQRGWQLRRRELGPPAVPRLPQYRRRHDQRAAGAVGDPPQRRDAGRVVRRPDPLLPQTLINVRIAKGLRLEERTTAGTCARRGRARTRRRRPDPDPPLRDRAVAAPDGRGARRCGGRADGPAAGHGTGGDRLTRAPDCARVATSQSALQSGSSGA